jgi:hypothetical protein
MVMSDHVQETVEETVAPVIEPVADPAPEAPVAEIPMEPPKDAPAPVKKTPWYMERINEETNKRRALEERAAEAERRAQEAQSLLERMQSGDKTTPQPQKTEQTDIQSLVKAEAARQRLYEDSTAVRAQGLREFSDFNDSLQVLSALGVTNDDFVQDVLAVDKVNAHKIFDALAKDPERAISLVGMDVRRRTAELTRISDKMSEPAKPAAQAVTPKPAPVSKAPAPKPVLDPASDGEDNDLTNDKMSDAEWSAKWDAKYRKRA